MDIPAARNALDRIGQDLRENILPFWMQRVVDRDRASFHGSLTNDLVVDHQVERGAVLTSRILWTFAAAHRQLGGPDLLEMAHHAYADLMERFLDRDHGGLFWSVHADGSPARMRKQVYGQAFGIYALTEYHRACGRVEPLEQARTIFRLLEAHARDREHGGYVEAFARDWSPIEDIRLSSIDMNEPKSQNTHLHVMEAYTNLLRAWPDAAVREALNALLDVMLDRVLNTATHHLGLFFSRTWETRSDRISYGHDIEAAWLLTEAASELGDKALLDRVRDVAVRIAEVTLAEGVDADGAVFNEGSPQGITDARKEWWPQAEAVVGFLNAYEISGDERHLRAALRLWEFIETRLIDRENGEWFRGVTRDGEVLADELKVGFWKCPYHNGRAGLEATKRLRAILARSEASAV